jgi:hypothetical protein
MYIVQVFNMVLGLKLKQHRMRSALLESRRPKITIEEQHDHPSDTHLHKRVAVA